jgi:hypothetical protein
MDCNVFVDIDRVRIRSFALMQKNQKITATSQFAFDYAETVEKNKLAPQKRGSQSVFFSDHGFVSIAKSTQISTEAEKQKNKKTIILCILDHIRAVRLSGSNNYNNVFELVKCLFCAYLRLLVAAIFQNGS